MTDAVNLELERDVLAVLLDQPEFFYHIPFVQAEHFQHPFHQALFSEIERRLAASEGLALPALAERMGEVKYLIGLRSRVLQVLSPMETARRVVELANIRRLLAACQGTLIKAQEDPAVSFAELAGGLQNEFQAVSAEEGTKRQRRDDQVTEAILERLKTRVSPTSTGLPKLDEAMGGGLYPGRSYGFAARKKVGKAQPLDARVLTLDGWKRMGEVKVGDRLASPDGLESFVTGVYPQGVKEILRVTFSDGRVVECCPDHLWEVESYRGKGREVVDTRELARRGRLSLPTYIPWFAGDFGGGELPIDPYLLGAIIGDGGITQACVNFSTVDGEMLDSIASAIPTGMDVRHIDRCNYRLRVTPKPGLQRACKPNPLVNELRRLGLSGKRSERRFIPTAYLTAAVGDRWEMLRGLMDTDGYVSDKGSICFDTSSPQLARDVRTLVRSLGGAAKIRRKATTHRDSYKVKIRHPLPSECFRLSRKKNRAIVCRKHQCRLTVKRVEFSRRAEAQCISVSHPRGLYVTDSYTVTHNTITASTISWNLNLQGVKHLFIAGEMGAEEIHERNLARALNCYPSHFRGPHRDDPAFLTRIAEVAVQTKRCIIYQDAPGLTFNDLRRYVASAIYQHKIQGIILDYWQLVGGKDAKRSTAEHLDGVAQWIADFCRQHGIWSVTMAQINQEGNTRGGEGIRLAFDQVYELHREDISQPYAWLEMRDTRYTKWMNIGSKDIPGLFMNEKGPYFEEV